jgi:tagatose-1,6-bisphosphate aldolase non-catalytic subunit AgaZ/GatZ
VAYLNIINKANKTMLKKMCKPLKIKEELEYFMRVNLMEKKLNRKFQLNDQVRDYWIRSGKGDKKTK